MRTNRRLITFHDYLMNFACAELKQHVTKETFPKGSDFRKYKLYLNTNDLTDTAINNFDDLYDQYWALREVAAV